ncbi:MAG: hypothetical protein HOG18_00080 [Proteobacteria bacterium]|nr:hypothetical protein [Pseudomonadota bacterium]
MKSTATRAEMMLPTSEPNQRNTPSPQIPVEIVWKRLGCVLGIEPSALSKPE